MTSERAVEARPLTKVQRAAIAGIERALLRAQRVGVAVCGMDSDLLAYRADDLDRIAEESSLYDAQHDLQNEYGTGVHIEDHGAYRDSGGW